MLPVGIHGGGDRLEIIRGDAFYQSYICHLPRSVVELAQSGRLDFLSAVLFPATCDVIRNLSGVWKLLYPNLYVRYLDLPQVGETGDRRRTSGGASSTLLARDLGEVVGRAGDRRAPCARRSPRTTRRARSSGASTRRASRRAVERADRGAVPADACRRARAARGVPRRGCGRTSRPSRRSRAACATGRASSSSGAFCEQPPLGLIKTIERAGCFIVDDDFLLGNRMIDEDVPLEGDPLENLAQAFVRHAVRNSTLYEPDPDGQAAPARRARRRRRGPTASSSRRRASATRRCSTGRCCGRAPRRPGSRASRSSSPRTPASSSSSASRPAPSPTRSSSGEAA